MSQPKPPRQAKLIIGFFLQDKNRCVSLVENLVKRFGDTDIISEWIPFDQTSYYEPEMGKPLYRRLMTFERLIHQDELPQIKLDTNTIEGQFADNGKRAVNIDPGYLLLERFVLATGKNFSHRIYIGKEIYADLTLVFRKGRFESLPWTFPDYAGQQIQKFLMRARQKYALNLKQQGSRAQDEKQAVRL
jgi:uncharacterized protein DUF4416